MSTAIAHRGPDPVGSYEQDGPGYRVSLGHRRLSIIDLSEAANQPFVKDGLALVFCGEIYNYRALQHDLLGAGASFDVLQACNPPETYWALAYVWRLFGKRFLFDHHDLSPEMYRAKFPGQPPGRGRPAVP